MARLAGGGTSAVRLRGPVAGRGRAPRRGRRHPGRGPRQRRGPLDPAGRPRPVARHAGVSSATCGWTASTGPPPRWTGPGWGLSRRPCASPAAACSGAAGSPSCGPVSTATCRRLQAASQAVRRELRRARLSFDAEAVPAAPHHLAAGHPGRPGRARRGRQDPAGVPGSVVDGRGGASGRECARPPPGVHRAAFGDLPAITLCPFGRGGPAGRVGSPEGCFRWAGAAGRPGHRSGRAPPRTRRRRVRARPDPRPAGRRCRPASRTSRWRRRRPACRAAG